MSVFPGPLRLINQNFLGIFFQNEHRCDSLSTECQFKDKQFIVPIPGDAFGIRTVLLSFEPFWIWHKPKLRLSDQMSDLRVTLPYMRVLTYQIWPYFTNADRISLNSKSSSSFQECDVFVYKHVNYMQLCMNTVYTIHHLRKLGNLWQWLWNMIYLFI